MSLSFFKSNFQDETLILNNLQKYYWFSVLKRIKYNFWSVFFFFLLHHRGGKKNIHSEETFEILCNKIVLQFLNDLLIKWIIIFASDKASPYISQLKNTWEYLKIIHFSSKTRSLYLKKKSNISLLGIYNIWKTNEKWKYLKTIADSIY